MSCARRESIRTGNCDASLWQYPYPLSPLKELDLTREGQPKKMQRDRLARLVCSRLGKDDQPRHPWAKERLFTNNLSLASLRLLT